MAGHAQLQFVMKECSKTQIRLMGPICGTMVTLRCASFEAKCDNHENIKFVILLTDSRDFFHFFSLVVVYYHMLMCSSFSLVYFSSKLIMC